LDRLASVKKTQRRRTKFGPSHFWRDYMSTGFEVCERALTCWARANSSASWSDRCAYGSMLLATLS